MDKLKFFNKCNWKLQNMKTPEQIGNLQNNEIFVFGSKPNGHHKSGAAKIAKDKFGASEGQGEGLSGSSYAIPVHRHNFNETVKSVNSFIDFAKANCKMKFYVIAIGCGNANLTPQQVAPFFSECIELDNVYLPESFIKVIKKNIEFEECDPLPIKYIDEEIHPYRLRGRALGLMIEISKRGDNPILSEEEILGNKNPFIEAFVRTASVIKKQESKVISLLLEEASQTKNYKDEQLVNTLEFAVGIKLDVKDSFEKGGCMYDLLVFTNKHFLEEQQIKQSKIGFHGEIKGGNLTVFEENDKFGLKDDKDKIIVKPIYDQIKSSGWSGRGWNVKCNGKWGSLNERGETIFDTIYDEIKAIYKKGHCVRFNGKMGYFDIEGNKKVDFLYDDIENFYDNWNGFKVELEGKYGYLDNNGMVEIPIAYDTLYLCCNGMILLEKDDKYGFYNVLKRNPIVLRYDYAESFYSNNNGETVVKKDNKRGVIDTNENIILPFDYDQIYINNNHTYRVSKNERMGIIDKDGNILFPFKYRYIGDFDEKGVAPAENEYCLYGYIDRKDNVIIPFGFRYAQEFKDGYAEVDVEYGKRGLINEQGDMVIPANYDFLMVHFDGSVEVEKFYNAERKKGIYDLKKNTHIPCIYYSIERLHRNENGFLICKCVKNKGDEHETIIVE